MLGKIFVVGYSGVGKTTYCNRFFETSSYNVVRASGWLGSVEVPSGVCRTTHLTRISKDRLKEDPLVCVKWITSQMKADKVNVIEGVRNPLDFFHLVNPSEDKVIHLSSAHLPPRGMDKGVDVIVNGCEFMMDIHQRFKVEEVTATWL